MFVDWLFKLKFTRIQNKLGATCLSYFEVGVPLNSTVIVVGKALAPWFSSIFVVLDYLS
jgi:hypothetical protein